MLKQAGVDQRCNEWVVAGDFECRSNILQCLEIPQTDQLLNERVQVENLVCAFVLLEHPELLKALPRGVGLTQFTLQTRHIEPLRRVGVGALKIVFQRLAGRLVFILGKQQG